MRLARSSRTTSLLLLYPTTSLFFPPPPPRPHRLHLLLVDGLPPRGRENVGQPTATRSGKVGWLNNLKEPVRHRTNSQKTVASQPPNSLRRPEKNCGVAHRVRLFGREKKEKKKRYLISDCDIYLSSERERGGPDQRKRASARLL